MEIGQVITNPFTKIAHIIQGKMNFQQKLTGQVGSGVFKKPKSATENFIQRLTDCIQHRSQHIYGNITYYHSSVCNEKFLRRFLSTGLEIACPNMRRKIMGKNNLIVLKKAGVYTMREIQKKKLHYKQSVVANYSILRQTTPKMV